MKSHFLLGLLFVLISSSLLDIKKTSHKAKKKEIKEVNLAGLGLDANALKSHLQVEGMALPRQDRLSKILDGDTKERVTKLLSILRQEEKVL